MNDSSPMPFGKYKDKKMANVPAEYLLWLFYQPWAGSWPDVLEYIRENLDVIKHEAGE